MSPFGANLKPRFAVLGIIIVAVLGALLVQLWSMQIVSGDTFALAAENNRVREMTIPAPRGRILDRNGKPLVTNRPSLCVAVPSSIIRDKKLLAQLSAVINVPVATIEHSITSSKLEAVQPRVVAVDAPQSVVSYLSEHLDDYPGVEVEVLPVRQYPYGSAAAHVLGYVGEISEDEMKQQGLAGYKLGDVIGKTGVEHQFESVLQGEKGYQRLEVDAKGRVRAVLDRREPIPGHDVKLTIDIDVQKVADQALANAIVEAHRQKFPKANAGAAVVLDVKTGEIVALASAPTYDPGKFVRGISTADWKAVNDPKSGYPLNDRAISSAYPPASTFKVVTGLAALQQGFVSASTAYDCPYAWYFPGHENSKATWWVKHDWNPSGHGVIDFVQAVEQSADTYFYPLGYKFYTAPGEKLQAFARAVGYGAKTGVDLPGEVPGRVPDVAWKAKYNANYPEWQKWLPGDTVNLAIGQGDLLVTPLQLTALFAGVANGGEIMRPHVLAEVSGSNNAPVLRLKPAVGHTVPVSASDLATMQRALLGVTQIGTGMGAFSGFPVEVAGKTGTAQVKGKDDLAVFGCYAPASAPKYAVVVLVEQGGHGGSVAAPAARQILEKLNGLKVAPIHAVTDVSR